MKHYLLTIAFFLIASITTVGQKNVASIFFDDTTGLHNYLLIDTITYPHNIWQIGKPHKTIFKSACSVPNAIVTDTMNPYPINDTSSFIITHTVQYPEGNCGNYITFLYNVNSDTLKDFGTIEYSLNNGPWINLTFSSGFPTLTGNSNGWESGYVYFHNDDVKNGDILRYRFMFYSDNIQTNKDGLMYDNINVADLSSGIVKPDYKLIFSKVFPNPVIDNLILEFDNKNNLEYKLEILDNTGKIVKTFSDIKNSFITISIKELSSGIYYYKLSNTNDKKYAIGKFIK